MEKINAVGRRKAAIARVFVTEGNGEITINKRSLEVYFPSSILQFIVKQPLNLLEVAEKYNINVNLCGGGYKGQAEALRLAIARALVTKAPVILADEPTANLDSVNSQQILSLMKSLNKDPDLQTTFIFSTHDSRIVDMCDHVLHILDGNIINDEYKTGSDVYVIQKQVER